MTHPPPPPVPPDWWRSLFDEVYLETDARSIMDADLTRREVEEVIRALALEKEEAILDLCGGQGRHALELARRGYRHVLVLDFSEPLLFRGRTQAQEQGLPVSFVRGDARSQPLREKIFQAVLCLANSFGYGASRRDDLLVLEEACRLLGPEGRLLLEVADPGYVREHLPRESWHEASGELVVCRRRWVTAERLICQELVLSRGRGQVRDRTYQVRLYDAAALEIILREAGFSRVLVKRGSEPHSRADRGALSRRLAATAWKD